MIGALAVQKRDRAVFYLQVDHIVAHIIQIIMIFVQREDLGGTAAEIDNGFQRFLPEAASVFLVTLMQRTCWQRHLQCGQRR